METMTRESPFACDMTALAPDERPIHIALIKQLFGSVKAVRELGDGYAFQLEDNPDTLTQLVEFISKERLCCPSFGFAIEVEPEGSALWLHITGREGIKPFIHVEFGNPLPKELAVRSGFLHK